MSSKRTEKSKYHSMYGGGYITAAQRLTEILCTIVAFQDNQELPDKFWQSEPWRSFYQSQIPTANSLLKQYPFSVIVQALHDKEIKNKIKSLRANWLLKPILMKYLKKLQKSTSHKSQELTQQNTKAKPRPSMGGLNAPSIVEQLRALEGD